jgi:hypothetical protein
MSRREDFDNAFWDDPEVEALSAFATLLYIWSWTNRRCGMSGVYKVSRQSMSKESKVPLDHLDATLAELEAGDFLYYEQNVLWVRSRVKRLRTRSPQIATSIENDIKVLAEGHPIRQKFLERYAGYAFISDCLLRLTRGSTQTTQESQSGGTSVEAHKSLHGNGNGTGKGVKSLRKETDARAQWTEYAAAWLPDLPADFVVSACMMLTSAGIDVTPDAVRARIERQYPSLSAPEAAA